MAGYFMAWKLEEGECLRRSVWDGLAYYKNLFHREPYKAVVSPDATIEQIERIQKIGVIVEQLKDCPVGEVWFVMPFPGRKDDPERFGEIAEAAGLIAQDAGYYPPPLLFREE